LISIDLLAADTKSGHIWIVVVEQPEEWSGGADSGRELGHRTAAKPGEGSHVCRE